VSKPIHVPRTPHVAGKLAAAAGEATWATHVAGVRARAAKPSTTRAAAAMSGVTWTTRAHEARTRATRPSHAR
jgi:hypothetical protein